MTFEELKLVSRALKDMFNRMIEPGKEVVDILFNFDIGSDDRIEIIRIYQYKASGARSYSQRIYYTHSELMGMIK